MTKPWVWTDRVEWCKQQTINTRSGTCIGQGHWNSGWRIREVKTSFSGGQDEGGLNEEMITLYLWKQTWKSSIGDRIFFYIRESHHQ